jgi:drug/metabolite transporter (DMT)-like permease
MLCCLMAEARKPVWLALGGVGFCFGLALFFLASNLGLAHAGLVLAIASPIIALYRILKPSIGRHHCPRPPEWMAR